MKNDLTIEYAGMKGFSNDSHLCNYIDYLFNLSLRYENEYTEQNDYFELKSEKFVDIKELIRTKYPKNFDDRKFREIEANKLKNILLKIDTKYIFNDLFYFTNSSVNWVLIYETCSHFMKNILNYEYPFLKKLKKDYEYVVFHGNQNYYPHIHRIFVVNENDLELLSANLTEGVC